MVSIATELKKLMLDRNITQTALAEKLGYTKQGFNNLLGRDNFKVTDIEKIADALGYDMIITFTSKK